MTLLTVDKKAQIVIALGYSWDNTSLFPQLSQDYPSFLVTKIDEILSQIIAIKQQKRSSFGNIQLKKVDEIEFQPLKDSDYVSAYDDLIHESLIQLSDLLSIPLAYGQVHQMSYQ